MGNNDYEGLSRFHRRQIKDDIRLDQLLESLPILDLTLEVYWQLSGTTNFIAIVGLALQDPKKPLTFFQAEALFYDRKKENWVVVDEPTGPFFIDNPQNTFKVEHDLHAQMWDEAE